MNDDIWNKLKITPHKQVWHPFNLEKATCKVCGYFHLLDVDDADAPEPLCDDCWQRYAPYFPGFGAACIKKWPA